MIKPTEPKIIRQLIDLCEVSDNEFYLGFYKWQLENGQLFPRGEQTPQLEEQIKKFQVSDKPNKCYEKAQRRTIASGGLIEYYEGWYVLNRYVPLMHGFNTFSGHVIDPTFKDMSKIEEYFGVNIPVEYIKKFVENNKKFGNILVAYYIDTKIIKPLRENGEISYDSARRLLDGYTSTEKLSLSEKLKCVITLTK